MQLLLLQLQVFLFLGGCFSTLHSQSQGPPEVTIPLKITDPNSGTKPSDWISYSLKFEGQRHIVRMKVIKHLLARHMPVFTYTDQGALREDYPFIQDNCYYYGYMDGDPESQVSLHTCFGGLDGLLYKDNTVYKVEPKLNSTTFQHLVYKLVNEEKEFPARSCGLTDKEYQCLFKSTNVDQLHTSKQSGIVGWWNHRRYFQLAMSANHDLYTELQSNVQAIQRLFTSIVSIVHTTYLQLDLYVTLVGIDIWTDRNHVNYTNNGQYLDHFCRYSEKTVNLRMPYNAINIIAKEDRFSKSYVIFINTACSETYKCGVLKRQNIDVTQAATVLSQVIGHQVGLPFDKANCVCGEPNCIMHDGTLTGRRFSNCSIASYLSSKANCLLNVPKEIRDEHCGNGVLEGGEACDCGTIDSCAADPCCETDCTLAPGANCAGGLCCQNCRILPRGTQCRRKENECDLPEWCNGTTSQCPDDVYVQSGISCEGGGYCHEKRCNKREDKCKRLFGDQAKRAGLKCHLDVNTRGDRFGNCGFDAESYTACLLRDSLCGRLQCENVKRIPNLPPHTTLISTNISGTNCWGIDYHLGANISNTGEVEDGTECGEHHICVKRQCLPISYFTERCSPEKCRMRGICNNRHHCHCNPPWRPPYCYVQGAGGSLDSGPPNASDFYESEEFSTDRDLGAEYTHEHIRFSLLLRRFIVFLAIFLVIVLRANI
ncbi:disintegrin and metalloproteinase domain-containing protein 21-like [Sorex araneus]|uniref:disintegrin and metalloproteinase domain-containing protein 21-like n=1 Tax=Sorex araneus TaxID=42254 RepID=UPI002433BE03|nr:disintegrin and metalloproteinase domain-containing protein 21-like [Sorex araneus]